MVCRTLQSMASYSLGLIDRMVLEIKEIPGSGDPGHVHEFRVALRKARVLLKVYPPSGGPPHAVQSIRHCLAQAGAVSNRLRDLDVMVNDLPGLSSDGGSQLPAMAPFLRWLCKHQVRQAAVLGSFVGSALFHHCLDMWKDLVVSGELTWPGPALACDEVSLLRDVRKHCGNRWDRAGTRAWHALRKEVKTVRYLVSIPGDAAKDDRVLELRNTLVEMLAEIQQILGKNNDLAVRIATVKGYLANPRHRGESLRATRKVLRRLQASDRLEVEKTKRQACKALERLESWSDWPYLMASLEKRHDTKEGVDADGGLL